MKKLVWLGAAVAIVAAPQAMAQGYTKGEPRMIDEAQYQQPQTRTAPPPLMTRNQQAPMEREAMRAAQTEPAAGSDPWYADFTGPYAGADVGYAMGSYEITSPAADLALDGMEYGVFAGFGFAQNFLPWLGGYGGIEAAYYWSEQDGDVTGVGFEKDENIVLTVRPGVTFNQDVLGYGILGWSYANFEGRGTDEDLHGLVLGAGAEFDTQTPLNFRLEYTYTNYEDSNLGISSFDGHENNIKLGALLRF
ncbi:MAG: porin family protein [Alphaproteobacteria bacterium]|nr:porin family protein [Alphaproteobacteria bacterium]